MWRQLAVGGVTLHGGLLSDYPHSGNWLLALTGRNMSQLCQDHQGSYWRTFLLTSQTFISLQPHRADHMHSDWALVTAPLPLSQRMRRVSPQPQYWHTHKDTHIHMHSFTQHMHADALICTHATTLCCRIAAVAVNSSTRDARRCPLTADHWWGMNPSVWLQAHIAKHDRLSWYIWDTSRGGGGGKHSWILLKGRDKMCCSTYITGQTDAHHKWN